MARDEEELDTCRFFSSYPDSETTTVEGHSGDGFRIQVSEIQTHDRVTSDVTTRIIAAPRKATYYGDSRSSSTLPDVVSDCDAPPQLCRGSSNRVRRLRRRRALRHRHLCRHRQLRWGYSLYLRRLNYRVRKCTLVQKYMNK